MRRHSATMYSAEMPNEPSISQRFFRNVLEEGVRASRTPNKRVDSGDIEE